LENKDSEDAIQIYDCPNPEYNDGDTSILVNINQTQFHTIVRVRCNKAGLALESSAHGDGLRILDCQNPGNTHGDTTILVTFIVGEFEISISTSQYTWRSFKSTSIDKLVTETRFIRIDNDTHISYVQFGLVFIEIRLVVLLSPQQHCNKATIINSNDEVPRHDDTNKCTKRLDSLNEVVNVTIFHRRNPTYHTGVGTIPVNHVGAAVVWFCEDNTKR
jgi:hypothetical protein